MGLRGSAGWLDRAIAAMNRSAWFRRLGPRIVPKLDRFVHRLSGGRLTLSGGYVPVIMLTAIGHRSGQPRTVPLAAMPDGPDRFVIVGSNFAREAHPAWSNNLLANPQATVAFRGRSWAVRARQVDDEERQQLWPRLVAFNPGYADYQERVTDHGRDLRIFLLEPTGTGDATPDQEGQR